ncbi:MAG: transcription elongation factor GreB [Gammaproteobacteria bacterium]|jgi:transcription elongation factor GreB
MTRYRPPGPKKSPYITREGHDILLKEQKQIWLRRREVVAAVSVAAAEGDRSENAEYIYRKKELREIDRRIRYLQKRLPDLIVVDKCPSNLEQVFFGAILNLETEDDETVRYRIVGPDEFDRADHYISMDSPLAQALLKKSLGDEVKVTLPVGQVTYLISSIGYDEAVTNSAA